MIYGYNLSYEELLQKANLPSLEERRIEAFRKFTMKTVKNEKYTKKWFPTRTTSHNTRNSNQYIEETAVGNRLYKSPIFAMRRLLNNNATEETVDLSGLFNDPY